MSWYNVDSKDNDVAIYTKITLSRNIKGFPFPNRMSDEQRTQVADLIVTTLNSDEGFSENFKTFKKESIPDVTLKALVEKKLIKEKFIETPLNKTLILSNDETVSIMLCSEDHIKLTLVEAGLNLEEAFNRVQELDGLICSSLPIAFDDRLGFLTESPMELGTALKAEVLLHLPTIESDGEIRSVADSVSRIGLSIKGLTDEEGYNTTSMYSLTNLITLGITERNAIENLNSIAAQIIDRERMLRESVDKIKAEDSIFRAVALLKSARLLDFQEAVSAISKLKIGISYGIIRGVPHWFPYSLLVESGEGALESTYGEDSLEALKIVRAEHIRKALANINI